MKSQVRFNRVPNKVPEKVALVQCQVRFNWVLEEIPEGFGAEPGYGGEPG